jgi:hypothetical protein
MNSGIFVLLYTVYYYIHVYVYMLLIYCWINYCLEISWKCVARSLLFTCTVTPVDTVSPVLKYTCILHWSLTVITKDVYVCACRSNKCTGLINWRNHVSSADVTERHVLISGSSTESTQVPLLEAGAAWSRQRRATVPSDRSGRLKYCRICGIILIDNLIMPVSNN